MADMLTYYSQNIAAYWQAVGEHLGISLIAVAIAALVGIPMGILSLRSKRISTFVTGVFNTLRIVPSLAILVLCIPLFGVGVRPALIALTVLAVPPILINTAKGFEGLSPSVLEAAKGMGMSSLRIFWTVKMPLAMPLMLAGLKTATVEVIASATLAAYIGAGGLGGLIFTGIGLFRTDLLLMGGLSVAALSLTASLLWSVAERFATRYTRTNEGRSRSQSRAGVKAI